MHRVYLETSGTPPRFWEASINGVTITTRMGIVGEDGKTSTQSFASEQDAAIALDSLKADRLRRGFSVVQGALAPTNEESPRPSSQARAESTPVAPSSTTIDPEDDFVDHHTPRSRQAQQPFAARVIHRLAETSTDESTDYSAKTIALYMVVTEMGQTVQLHLRLDQPMRRTASSSSGPLSSQASQLGFWRATVDYDSVQSAHQAVDLLLKSPEKAMRFLEAYGSTKLKQAIAQLDASSRPLFRVEESAASGNFPIFTDRHGQWPAVMGYYRSAMSAVVAEALNACTVRSDFRFVPADQDDVLADYAAAGVGDLLDVGQHLVAAVTKVSVAAAPLTETVAQALQRYVTSVWIEAGTFGPAKQLYKILSRGDWAEPFFAQLAVRFEVSHRYGRVASQTSAHLCWCSVCQGRTQNWHVDFPTYPALRALLPRDTVSGRSMRYISRRSRRELSWTRRNEPRRYCQLALEMARGFAVDNTEQGPGYGHSLLLEELTHSAREATDREVARDRRNWLQNPEIHAQLLELVVVDGGLAQWMWQTLPSAQRRSAKIPMSLVLGLLEAKSFELQIAAVRSAIADFAGFIQTVGAVHMTQRRVIDKVGKLIDDLDINELKVLADVLRDSGTSSQRMAFLEACLSAPAKPRLSDLVAATRPADLVRHLDVASPAARAVLLSLHIEGDDLLNNSDSSALFGPEVVVDTTIRFTAEEKRQLLQGIDASDWMRALDLLAVLPTAEIDPELLLQTLDSWFDQYAQLDPNTLRSVLVSLFTSRHSALREVALTQLVDAKRFPSLNLDYCLASLNDVQLAALIPSAINCLPPGDSLDSTLRLLVERPMGTSPERFVQSLLEAQEKALLSPEQLVQTFWWLLRNMPQLEIELYLPTTSELTMVLMSALEPQYLRSPSESVVNFITSQQARKIQDIFVEEEFAFNACQSEVPEWQELAAHSLIAHGVTPQNWIRLMEIDTPAVTSILAQVLDTKSGNELVDLLSLALDSSVESVRTQAIGRLQAGLEDADLGMLYLRLAETNHPDTAALVAARLLSVGLTDADAIDRFDRQILFSIGTNRRPKELIFKRREQSDVAPSPLYISTLKSLARSMVSRDAEWALAQLTRLQEQGHDCGLTVAHVSGDAHV